ncbi:MULTISPECIES: tyrosine-type recombinase/integrase [unclassified Microbacterium]|uniref:tyrosine-type recombinase/integrase n=1 Tax=unclassified Microbacterium TaxID=2609290 RepID=UPI003862F948
MASVTPRATASGEIRWRVQARHDGRMQQVTFLQEEGARQFGDLVDRVGWSAASAVLAARKNKRPTVPTLRQWTHTYLDQSSGLLTGIEEGTRADYVRAADRSFISFLGEMPIDAITKADVGRWVAWQEQQPSRRGPILSAKTVKNYHAILSATMSAAVDHGVRPDNPAHKTRISRGVKREGVFLSVEEYTTLLHFIPDRYTAFVMFLANSGCRWGEATAVTWGDLNLRSAPPTIRIDKAWKKAASGGPVLKHPKSSMSRRTVSLPADVVDAMGTPQVSSDLIFPNRNGGHLWMGRFRGSVWNPAVEKARDAQLCRAEGLTVLRKAPTPHDLRHSHASWLIAAGAPLPFVQARLGHESITTTIGTYGHLQPDAHVQMADIIGNTLSGTRPMRQIDDLYR